MWVWLQIRMNLVPVGYCSIIEKICLRVFVIRHVFSVVFGFFCSIFALMQKQYLKTNLIIFVVHILLL